MFWLPRTWLDSTTKILIKKFPTQLAGKLTAKIMPETSRHNRKTSQTARK